MNGSKPRFIVKSIDTTYAGCRFRSRLEARWAVFFDELRIAWEYEPERYGIDNQRYLPDFYLPQENTWVEVKGTEESLDKPLMRKFAYTIGPIIVLGPMPRPAQYNFGWVLLSTSDGIDPWYEEGTFSRQGVTNEGAQDYAITPDKWLIPVTRARYNQSRSASAAYTAARSARFEHGQKGAFKKAGDR